MKKITGMVCGPYEDKNRGIYWTVLNPHSKGRKDRWVKFFLEETGCRTVRGEWVVLEDINPRGANMQLCARKARIASSQEVFGETTRQEKAMKRKYIESNF